MNGVLGLPPSGLPPSFPSIVAIIQKQYLIKCPILDFPFRPKRISYRCLYINPFKNYRFFTLHGIFYVFHQYHTSKASVDNLQYSLRL